MLIKNFRNPSLKNSLEKFLFYYLMLFCFIVPIHPEIAQKISIIGFFIIIFVVDFKRLYTTFNSNTFLKAIFLFIVFCIFSYFWSDNYPEFKKIIRVIFKYWIVPTIFFISVFNKFNLKYAIISFLSGMIVNFVLSYSMYFFNLKKILNFSFSEFQLVPFQASHMEYSIYITISTILFFYYFLKSKSSFLKIILFIISVTSLILLFLLEGRTGQISFIITFLLLAIIYSKKSIHLIISFTSITIILILAYLLSTNFNSRINKGLNDLIEVTNSNYNTSLGVRLSSYKIIPEIIQSTNLLFGVGIGDSRDITTQINKKIYNDSFDAQKGLLHQSFLTIFHSVGFVGITLFIFSLYKLYTLKVDDNEINFIKYVFIVSLVVDLMTNEFFRQREILLLFALFSSIIIVASMKKIELEHKH